MTRVALVATVKNEGPYLLEWVAYHLEIGFGPLLVFQNDSTDTTVPILKTLAAQGVLRFFQNSDAPPGRHQLRAYRRATRQPEYQAADWVMALDVDEFLNIHAGAGTVQDLIAALPEVDQAHLNWKIFGAGGAREITEDLVTERFTRGQTADELVTHDRQFKTLFRRARFTRPGIHHALGPKVPEEEIRTTNGSGLAREDFRVRIHRCSDPGQYRLAQVNHYMLRDAAAFVLKGVRGTAHGDKRDFGQAYWDKNNHNAGADRSIQSWLPRIRARMAALDEASGGRLMRLRAEAFAQHRAAFDVALEDPTRRTLYDYCLAHP